MGEIGTFRPFDLPYFMAVGQCQKCFQVVSYDLEDYIAKIPLIHNPPHPMRMNSCGGRLKLFQEGKPSA